eukprot:TRINITY_DN426_c1_g1_i3.p1 TRINITY_DN426_c1_g1~~TRINITY_DN426_c1_g1_i3.p1  ORF type:complete len:392 (-),score=179.24 TRINITY_DN426_c1_g1_i3:681-1856(-)
MRENIQAQIEERKRINEEQAARDALLQSFDEKQTGSGRGRSGSMFVELNTMSSGPTTPDKGSKSLLFKAMSGAVNESSGAQSAIASARWKKAVKRAALVSRLQERAMTMQKNMTNKERVQIPAEVLRKDALRVRFFRFASEHVTNSGMYSERKQELWERLAEYESMAVALEREEDMREFATELFEEYLDEDSDDPVAIDFGVQSELLVLLSKEDERLSRFMFDDVFQEVYAASFKAFEEMMLEELNGPGIAERVKNMSLVLAHGKLRTMFDDYMRKKYLPMSDLSPIVQAFFKKSMNALHSLDDVFISEDDRRETFEERVFEVVEEFFDDESDMYMCPEPFSFGEVIQYQQELERGAESTDVFDKVFERLYADGFKKWKEIVLEEGDLVLI